MTAITIEAVVDELGLEVGRDRKLMCPSHDKETASLHLYEDSFYCFGCGKSGDAYGLLAWLTDRDVRDVLRERGDGRADPHRRTSTKGLRRGAVANSVLRKYRQINSWFFNELHLIYRDAPLPLLLRALEIWCDVFDDKRDWLVSQGVWDGEEPPAPYVAEKSLDEFKAHLVGALEIERGVPK